MKKIDHLTYSMSKADFLNNKRNLYGYVFWREENGEIIIRFATSELETYFI